MPAEDQFESTVGKAMNTMFAKIATGGTVTADDVKAALKTPGPGGRGELTFGPLPAEGVRPVTHP